MWGCSTNMSGKYEKDQGEQSHVWNSTRLMTTNTGLPRLFLTARTVGTKPEFGDNLIGAVEPEWRTF